MTVVSVKFYASRQRHPTLCYSHTQALAKKKNRKQYNP